MFKQNEKQYYKYTRMETKVLRQRQCLIAYTTHHGIALECCNISTFNYGKIWALKITEMCGLIFHAMQWY